MGIHLPKCADLKNEGAQSDTSLSWQVMGIDRCQQLMSFHIATILAARLL